jgi:hypothetical protein
MALLMNDIGSVLALVISNGGHPVVTNLITFLVIFKTQIFLQAIPQVFLCKSYSYPWINSSFQFQ